MSGSISYQPMLVTNAYGGFSVQSDGFVQGVFSDDPATRFELAGGVLASSETLPMWGGILIYENIPGAANTQTVEMGSLVGRGTAQPAAGTPFAFSVFNQAAGMIQTPTSPVPLASVNMGVHYFRSGSNARIQVACDPALAAQEGSSVYQSGNIYSWDLQGQQLVPYNTAAWTANTITNASFSNGTITFTAGSSPGMTAGAWFTVTGVTPSGYNGTYKAISGTSTTTLVTNIELIGGVLTTPIPTNPGSFVSAGVLQPNGGAATGFRVLRFQIGNSLTVGYNYNTGVATWNRGGSCAEILI